MSTVGPTYPTSSSGWTNSNNANASDGSNASDTFSTVWDPFDSLWDSTDTLDLNCGTFTGIATGISVTDTINSISVSVSHSKSGGTLTGGYCYLYRGGAYVGNAVLSAGSTTDTVSFSGAGWTSANLPTLSIGVMFECHGSYATSGTKFVDYVNVTVDYTVTYVPDIVPAAFTFTDVTGANPSSVEYSNVINVSACDYCSFTLTASDPGATEYSVNSGAWTNSAVAHAALLVGDYVQLRITASSSYSAGRNATLDLGGVSDVFSVTTRAEDTTPDAFYFSDDTGALLSSAYTSNYVQCTGIDASTSISVSGGEYQINSGSFTTAAGTINLNDYVRVRQTSSATAGATTNCTLDMGGVSDTYSVTTAIDTTPDAFAFTAVTGAAISTTYTSNTVTIVGINSAAAVSFSSVGSASALEYSKNGGAWTALGATTASLADQFRVRMTTSATPLDSAGITMTVGGVSGTYNITNGAADFDPDALNFTSVSNCQGGQVYTSNTITLSGMTPAISTTATIGADGEIKVNAGAWTTGSAAVQNGDSVTLRVAASRRPNTTVSVVLTIGTTVGSYSVRSRPAMMFDF